MPAGSSASGRAATDPEIASQIKELESARISMRATIKAIQKGNKSPSGILPPDEEAYYKREARAIERESRKLQQSDRWYELPKDERDYLEKELVDAGIQPREQSKYFKLPRRYYVDATTEPPFKNRLKVRGRLPNRLRGSK